MAKKQFMLLASLLLVLSVFLAACTGKDNDAGETKTPDKEKPKEEEKAGEEEEEVVDPNAGLDFPLTVTNTGTPIDGGELNYALVSDTPFEGTLSPVFYSGSPDSTVMSFFNESLFAIDGDFLITNDGAATYEISEDYKTITITIRDGVKWHDGEPVKASDLLYSYQLLGHPDYTGTRYTFMISNVDGMPAYHNGETTEISGITVSDDDRTISITYTEATPSLLSGIWGSATPRHHVGDVMTGEVTIEELAASEKIRTSPIGFGAYKVKKIVPGESVLYERNDDYWRGKPALDSIVLKVVSSASILEALKKGDVDIASIPVDQYLNAKEVDNIELLAEVDLAYTYIGFKLGKWDADKKESVTDPNAKMGNKLVRQAMWWALDNETIGKELYHGLRFPGTTLIVPVFASFHDASIPTPSYDPEKAKALLDEAGYVDVDGDGFRENDKGEKFELNFASMSGGETAEPIAQFYIQNWADVGIKVQLLEGRLHEFNSFYDRVEADDPDIDIYQGAWGVGSDPNPSGLYGRTAAFNYTRFTSEKNDELLAAISGEKSLDTDYRAGKFKEWQELMVDEVPVAPTVFRYYLMAVNKRVTNYSIETGTDLRLWKWGVTE
ncbi:oligopeptide ABC transporter substrate-binding protein [Sporosarcina thermotolerans]|uniref:Oligopeptide ABC transporter substrate-binding protein n=1 Tax=Sporosarcina thermotolerans TaxID=633404 RepID=A0AAW9A8F9_9BACL|nr:oligopeptide ABC transporter substrate-binding protein [Sporosarcina thermotolerans]MDW0116610.1 oligopeptide ABC transporter substrate-binding protein [Sporosarcina thermotolerans]WHT48821.1 oligopeptide ABC transporter substrate-binding protein [Sporosarcina thermotolerans]